tara:strand:- start:74 stop:274 length:201 start_codon:yes stop_codon:yes gene_type:complete
MNNLKPYIERDLLSLTDAYKKGVWHGFKKAEKSYSLYMSIEERRERYMYKSGYDFGWFLTKEIPYE